MHLGIFGLSGAGKTTLANMVAERNPEFSATSASKLIQEFGGVVEYEQLNLDNVRSNQEILALAYHRYKGEHPCTLIELHGLIETESGVELIDPFAILALNLDAAFFLYTPAESIAKRRLSDSAKKRRLASATELERLQDILLSSLQSIFNDQVVVLDENNAIRKIEHHIKSSLS